MQQKVYNISKNGSLQYEVIAGQAPVTNNTVYDADQEEDYFPATGTINEQEQFSNAGGLRGIVQNIRARKNLKAQAKASKIKDAGKAKVLRATSKVDTAKAQQIAAKALSVQQPVSKTVIKNSSAEKKSMSTGVKVGIGVGVAVVLIIVGVVIYKKMHKHKK